MGTIEEPLNIIALDVRDELLDLYDFHANLFNTKLKDPNITRANNTNVKSRNFVYPEFPEKFDDRFPRIVVKFGQTSDSEYAVNQLIDTNYNEAGDAISELYGTIMRVPVTVSVVIKKDFPQNVQFANGTNRTLQNTALADYLVMETKKLIIANRSNYIENRFELASNPIIQPQNIENQYVFVRVINFDVEVTSVYKKSFATGDIIRVINESYTLQELS